MPSAAVSIFWRQASEIASGMLLQPGLTLSGGILTVRRLADRIQERNHVSRTYYLILNAAQRLI